VRHTLDPKLDVVFKLLFADERNRELLISLLNAILEPVEPIVDVVVLNPDTPKETVVDKGCAFGERA
jgi:PD-(D/E)XK nuclease family transposase